MLLEAYFDDSGKEADKKNRFTCIAGYSAPSGCWETFNRKWAGTLEQHRLPELHMKHWFRVKRDKGWDDAQAGLVLNDFIDVIRDGRLWGFGAGVDARQWKALPREKYDKFGSAHEFVMQRVFRMIVDEMDTHGLHAHLNLVFDQDEDFSKPRLTRYYGVKRIDGWAKSLASIISFADARACYSLQAADLLANFTRARLRDKMDGKPATPHWHRLMTPLDGRQLRYNWDGWTGPDVETELTRARWLL